MGRIRVLPAAGLPTRVIRQVLPCTAGTGVVRPCPGALDALHDRQRVLDRRAAELDTAREVLRETIAAAEARQAPVGAGSGAAAERSGHPGAERGSGD